MSPSSNEFISWFLDRLLSVSTSVASQTAVACPEFAKLNVSTPFWFGSRVLTMDKGDTRREGGSTDLMATGTFRTLEFFALETRVKWVATVPLDFALNWMVMTPFSPALSDKVDGVTVRSL